MKPKFSGRSSVDCSINFICDGAGVQVVARVPSAGPVPPPTNVVMPTYVVKFREKDYKHSEKVVNRFILFLKNRQAVVER